MPALAMNHAMVYSKDVARSVEFYAGLLGLEVLQEVRGGPRLVYARLKSPGGDTTIAVHLLESGQELHTGGVRLYFEVPELGQVCRELEQAGATFTRGEPKMMPWGWEHVYLNDPDGHEVSLYWSGGKRLEKIVTEKR